MAAGSLVRRRRIIVVALAVASAGAAACGPDAPRTWPAAVATAGTPDVVGDLPVPAVVAREVGRFDEPVAVVARPSEPVVGRLHVAERAGRILGFVPGSADRPVVVLDVTDRTVAAGERGLLGFAFDRTGSRVVVHLTDPDGDTEVATYRLDAGGVADPASRAVVLRVRQPYANHNGGQIVLGPDGAWYLGLGDGGSAGDPGGVARDPSSSLGKILRIEPDAPAGTAPTIWSTGLRNPWRFAFDRATGDLWVGDVGQNEIEEVSVVRAADGAGRDADFGWDAFEGSAPFEGGAGVAPDTVPPWFEYRHDADPGGCSVTGGVVYRGARLPGLVGRYLFADFCRPGVRSISSTGAAGQALALTVGPERIVSFGEDADGEVYVVSLDGAVARLEAADGGDGGR